MKSSYFLSRLIKKMRLSAIVNSKISKTSKVESGSTVVNSSMDSHSFCGYDCILLNVRIGKFCSIASKVSIGGVAHPIGYVSTSPVFLSHKDSVRAKFSKHEYLPTIETVVGNDVWIGEGVYIKAGVSIGNGAVVGMGSVVTKNVEPYSIVAGNPARIIRRRFDDDVIEGLNKLTWWDLPDKELFRLAPLFNNPRELLRSEGLL
tara:strand:+ start:1096 stop:1707 length:612 start_codon:yes stop_codon:yes gene_type:complete